MVAKLLRLGSHLVSVMGQQDLVLQPSIDDDDDGRVNILARLTQVWKCPNLGS
jgi:hypothetical protein